MKKVILLFLNIFFATTLLFSQKIIKGVVTDEKNEALIGATVQWLENEKIVTTTDTAGYFLLPRPSKVHPDSTLHLLVRYVGYDPMRVAVASHETMVMISVEGVVQLEEVKIAARRGDLHFSTLKTLNVEEISSNELRKAPCCNLSESFETNPTVDVQYTDAVTGAKEIQMLGLRGIYTQLMVENRPTLGGIATPYALEFLPGTWLQSIQISKGASTVLNGYESITGQINTELVKPVNGDFLFFNLFGSQNGRVEANVNYNQQLSKRWSTGLLLHFDDWKAVHDRNGDTFLDVPAKRQFTGLSRWFYHGKKLEGQFNVQALTEKRDGGQVHSEIHEESRALYKIRVNADRIEVFGKMGYTGFEKPYNNAGSMANFIWHRQQGVFGNNRYFGEQQSGYANLIYETIINNSAHKLKFGSSYKYENYQESLNDKVLNRIEHVPGAFAEYNFNNGISPEKAHNFWGRTAFVAGFRLDYHNLFGWQPTPRLNVKYNFDEHKILRFSAGRGWRVPNLLAENTAWLASNRIFVFNADLKPESAWNYGMNYTQNFEIAGREVGFNFDFYRTDFTNQLIVDVLSDATKVQFYNLDGKSYANSFLSTFSYEPIKGLELRLAYKFNDVKVTFNEKMEQRPLLPRHSGLANVHYTTPNKNWKINATMQFIGSQVLPPVSGDKTGLPQYRFDERSPAYNLLNVQVSKIFSPVFEIYAGVENALNYRQQQPIIGWNNAFNERIDAPKFDATAVFAPIMGTMVYAGLRYTIAQSPNIKTVMIKTSAQCSMCKATIEKALRNKIGIKEAILDEKTKMLTTKYDKKYIAPEQIRGIISEAGYDADDLRAAPAAYAKLPSCCKKE